MTFVDERAGRRAAHGAPTPGSLARGEMECEVCIVGATLAGLWLALGLALRGRDVVVLDPGEGDAGDPLLRRETLRPGLGLTATALCAVADRDTARRLHHFSQTAYMRAVRLLEALGFAPEAEGFIHVPGPRGRLDLIDEAASRDTLGLQGLATLGAGHIAALIGTSAFVGALHDPQAATYSLTGFPRRLAAAASAAGARLLPRTPVVGADVNGVRKYLTCPTLRVRADHVAFCMEEGLAAAAPWLRRALGRGFFVEGVFAPRDTSGTADETVREGGQRGLAFAWQAGKLRVRAPTATHTVRAGAAAVVLRRQGSRLFPTLRRAVTGEARGGSIGTTVHGLPLIGSPRPGVWYAVALGHQAVVNAAMAADLITAAMVDRDDAIQAFAPFAAERSRQVVPALVRPVAYWMGHLADAAERRRAEENDRAAR
ncbi:FAD-binding oxidoreductase [Aquabacter sp. L1I39]|uniref:FAD-dependent oxidoreductase n=1 Tax=Aquabacter sp. L1I39 TaxID=2820278 RepID=UPI001ADAB143|nr:FAD-dependent oxidoreductase [Aquabacter sp. L1I39]QTL01623.1 FAD-binding oxidoreductase [Aquabacter sp. L1I39]